MKEVLKKIAIAPFIFLIRFYQTCISPLKQPCCRFTPTCSQYALEAFRKHGPFKGLYLTVRRILRCHPWGGHGYDPVPYRKAHPALPSLGRTRIRSGTLNCCERDIQEADSGKESKSEHHSGKEQSEDIHIFLLIKEKRYHQQDKQWHRKHKHEM